MSKHHVFYSPHVREYGRTPENTVLTVTDEYGNSLTYTGELKLTRLRDGGISVITVGLVGSDHFSAGIKVNAKVGKTRLKKATLNHFYEAFAH